MTNLDKCFGSAIFFLSIFVVGWICAVGFRVRHNENVNPNFDLSVFPNPAQDIITISYQMKEATGVAIDVVDMTGKSVQTILKSEQFIGPDKIQFSTEELSNGLYLLRINSLEGTQSTRFSVLH